MLARVMRLRSLIGCAARQFLWFALASCAVADRAVAAEPSCQPLTEYDAITATVAENFYDRTFRGLDWPKRVAAARRKLSCKDDTQAVAAKINRLLSELHASHTGVFTREDPDYWALQSVFSRSIDQFPVDFSGIWPIRLKGRWYAKYVLPGTPAAASGVQPGDELISIDGKPFRPLGIGAAAPSLLVLSRDGRTKQSVAIQARNQAMQKFFLDATQDSTRRLSVGARNVGYFRLWAGTHDLFLKSLNDALAGFEGQKVDALILDLRGGFGGAGLEYLANLKQSAYLGALPKYFLIDDGVRSGKEWVSGTVKVEHLGTLVGSTTAGMFLAGTPFHFFDDRYLLYLAVQSFDPPGIAKIEGVGVSPDVEVAPCRRACAGKDPQLDEAVELIRALPAPVAVRAG
jgi:carboxyl-terminal processing protease